MSSGHAAFLDPDVNRKIKDVLNEWGRFLQVYSQRPVNHAEKQETNRLDS